MCKCVAQRTNVVAGDQQNVAVQQFTRKVVGFVGWNKNDLKDRMLVIAIKSSHRKYVGQVKKERHGSLWLILRWGLVSNVQREYFRDRHQDSLIYGTSRYKMISQASIVKRIEHTLRGLRILVRMRRWREQVWQWTWRTRALRDTDESARARRRIG